MVTYLSLNLEGNDVSTGLKWMLGSNSVVFMPSPSTAITFAMESKLVPYIRNVPVKRDGSDLLGQLEWGWISEQATKYIENLWTSEQAQKDLIVISNIYWGICIITNLVRHWRCVSRDAQLIANISDKDQHLV